MAEVTFRSLLRRNEADLQRIREKYFPLLERRLITGYNLYAKLFEYSEGTLFLDYLHSDLEPTDRHFMELTKRLQQDGGIDLDERVIVNSKLVERTERKERVADYITLPTWENPSDMRYFDFDGNEVPKKKSSRMPAVIGESIQYDLLIKANSENELRILATLFKRCASRHQLDRNGRKILVDNKPVRNIDAIFEPSDVPVLICTNTKNTKPPNLPDFVTVTQFNVLERIGNIKVVWSTLARTQARGLYHALKEKNQELALEKKYALRVFVEDYLDNA